MFNRKCDCPITHGVTTKRMTNTKIFMCDEHGLICPFDSWQFKTPEELLEHLQTDENDNLHCEGRWRYGDWTLSEAMFELQYVIERNKSK